jgi:hypothetical protein
LVGIAYQARATDLDSERCINLYLESVESGDGSAPGALYSCPQLDTALTFGTSPVRALSNIDGVLYAIAGNTCYSVSSALAVTTLGTIGTSLGAAYIVSNSQGGLTGNLPNQIGFFDSTGLWSWTPSTSTFASVTLPFTGTVGVPCTLDGFVFVSQVGTYNIWQSNANDLTTWQALNFTTEDGNPEPIVGLITLHDQVLVFKQFSYVPYVNAGLNGFVLQRLEGVYPNIGLASPTSLFLLHDSVYWLGKTNESNGRIYQTRAYAPEEISTYAISNSINNYSTVADCIGFGYGQAGHTFACFTFPTGNETWVFDASETEKLKRKIWHQRAMWSSPNFNAYDVTSFAELAGTVYGGSNSTGNLYALNLGAYNVGRWLRSWRAQQGPAVYQPTKCNYLDIQMTTGQSVNPNSNPQVVLRQSLDNGAGWNPERYCQAGKTGQTMASVRFRRLGATKRGLNSDRVFELSSTDLFPAFLMGADIG